MTSDTPETTLDQRRAADAMRRVCELRDGDNSVGHYVSYVAGLPATVVTNGLGQALAMLLAQAKGETSDPHYQLYRHVAGWLGQQIPQLAGEPEFVIQHLMAADQRVYLRAQVEAMAYLQWLKQFARAYLSEAEADHGRRGAAADG